MKFIIIAIISKIYLGFPQIIKYLNSSELFSNLFFCIIIYNSQDYKIIYNTLFIIISISIILLYYYYDELKKYYQSAKIKYEIKKNENQYDKYIFIKKIFIIIMLYINNNFDYLAIIILLLYKLIKNTHMIIFLFIFCIIGRYLYKYKMTFINNNNKLFWFIRIISIIIFFFGFDGEFSPLFKLIIVCIFGFFDGLFKTKINNEYGNISNDNIMIKSSFTFSLSAIF